MPRQSERGTCHRTIVRKLNPKLKANICVHVRAHDSILAQPQLPPFLHSFIHSSRQLGTWDAPSGLFVERRRNISLKPLHAQFCSLLFFFSTAHRPPLTWQRIQALAETLLAPRRRLLAHNGMWMKSGWNFSALLYDDYSWCCSSLSMLPHVNLYRMTLIPHDTIYATVYRISLLSLCYGMSHNRCAPRRPR